MSYHKNGFFYRDNLVNYYCLDCQKSFIVGEELSESVEHISCPYCQSKRVDESCICDDEERIELLGCLGISFAKTDNNFYFDYCFFCNDILTSENIKCSHCCVSCYNKNHSEGGNDCEN